MNPRIQKGKVGEDLASQFLVEKGYKILARNWRFGRHEVDIIAQWNDLLVFVEVKTRQTNFFGYPEEAVSLKKQKAIAKVATAYLAQQNRSSEIRFDIVAITLTTPQPDIRHIEDAFFLYAD